MCIRIMLGLGSALLLFVHFYWPDVEVDSVTILLVLLLIVALCWPSVRRVLPFVRRLSVGGVEVSISDAVKALSSKAERAEEERRAAPPAPVREMTLAEEVEEVDTVARTSPQAAILLLSAKLERALRNLAAATSIADRAGRMPLTGLLRALDEAGVLGQSTVAALNDFRAIRNSVAHGVDASRGDLDAILGVGTRLLTAIGGMRESPEATL